MAKKPSDITIPTIHTRITSEKGLICPTCGSKLRYCFNDGGRRIVTLKGIIWVVENYYHCMNKDCKLNQAFAMVYQNTLDRKKFDLGVWGKVVYWHFRIHLNYEQIVQLMSTEYDISISSGGVADICEYFEGASADYVDKTTQAEVRQNGQIVLSLDGSQPIKGEPSLWAFSDRITGRVLLYRLLDTAPAEILKNVYHEIENKYGVPIVAFISDRQQNIVNSVKDFNLKIQHAYCQYHFLGHIVEGIKAKDTHLGAQIGKLAKKISIVMKRNKIVANDGSNAQDSIYSIFKPLAEEILCAIATYGDHFTTFPGLECYKNLEYIAENMRELAKMRMDPKYLKSLTTVLTNIDQILTDFHSIKVEIEEMLPIFRDLRDILGQHDWSSEKIKEYITEWKRTIHKALQKRGMDCNEAELGFVKINYKSDIGEIYQQWLRLESSYHDGIYLAYDNKLLEFTNNAKEQIFHRVKSHFKSMLGRQNVADAFQRHGGVYSLLSGVDLTQERIHDILITVETSQVEGFRDQQHAIYAETRRTWRIREINTGNMDKLKENIRKAKI